MEPLDLPQRLLSLLVAQGGAVTAAQARAAGLTPHHCRLALAAGTLQRAGRGLLVVPGPADELTMVRRAVALTGGVASHESAALALGLPRLARTCPPVVTVAGDRHRLAGITVVRAALPSADRLEVGGLPVTTPLRTCLDLARHRPARESVMVLEAALHGGLVAAEDLRSAVVGARGPGAPALRRAVAVADGRGESPLESLLWLAAHVAGIAPLLDRQVRFVDADGHVLRADFASRGRRVVVECDGFAHHGDRRAWRHEVRLSRRLAALGLRVVRVCWEDQMTVPDEVVADLGRLLGRPVPPHRLAAVRAVLLRP